MQIKMDGKVAVVTGGASGIGLEIARTLGECGAKVAICNTNPGNLKKAMTHLETFGIDVFGGICDIRESESLLEFADNVIHEFGYMDIWINNAGICPRGKVTEMNEKTWDDIFDTNLKSIFFSAKIARNKMCTKGGVMVNAASIAGIIPSVTSGVYAASKSAVISITKSLAAELAPFGIRVCAYAPGVIKTSMTIKQIEREEKEAFETDDVPVRLQPIPLRRYGKPAEVADLVAFLASDKASYINGTCVEITGGKFCVQNASSAWIK